MDGKCTYQDLRPSSGQLTIEFILVDKMPVQHVHVCWLTWCLGLEDAVQYNFYMLVQTRYQLHVRRDRKTAVRNAAVTWRHVRPGRVAISRSAISVIDLLLSLAKRQYDAHNSVQG